MTIDSIKLFSLFFPSSSQGFISSTGVSRQILAGKDILRTFIYNIL